MRPKLFKANQTVFDGNGLGYLELTTSCTVKQSLNGTYELNMQILKSDALYNSIEVGAIILAKPDMTEQDQPFVIEQITKNIEGVLDIYAVHIAQYRSRLIPVAPYEATDLADAISKAISNSLENNIFSLSTNKSVATAFSITEPRSFRELLGGKEGSLLDVYGGEYKFDRLNIELLNRRGRPNAFNVVYGRNMVTYDQIDEFDWTNSITGLIPYAKYNNDQEEVVVVGDVQYSSYADTFPYKKTIVYDFSDKFDDETQPTVSALNQLAIEYLADKGQPIVNIKASFEDVSTLPMFNDLNSKINTLQLGDSVRVINSMYNTNVTTRIREFEFNVLLERYNSITIGDAVATINDAISDIGGGNVVNYYGGGGGSGWYVDEYSEHQGATPINADTLSGYTYNELPLNLDLLWTNPNPSSSFASQTIQLDLSEYEYIGIIYRRSSSSTYQTPIYILGVGTSWYWDDQIGGYLVERSIQTTSSTVVFGNSSRMTTYPNGSRTTDNQYQIPYKIYGIKTHINDKTV